MATGVAQWTDTRHPPILLTGSTAWGREVASRVAAARGAGLTGDAVGLTVEHGRLVAWKPAFGGTLVAAITATSPVQMATVRPGILPLLQPAGRRAARGRAPDGRASESRRGAVTPSRGRHRRARARRDRDRRGRRRRPELLRRARAAARALGRRARGHSQGDRQGLDAARTTDRDNRPRHLAPLYIALGTSGKYNHTVGVRSAGTIVAVNPDPDAPVFEFADVGIVGDWREVVLELERQLRPLVS